MVSALVGGSLLGNIPQQELFRLAALVYTEFNDDVSTNELLFGIIRSIFVEKNNQEASIETIIANILNHFKIIITEDETLAIIKQHYASFDLMSKNKTDYYKLTDHEYKRTMLEATDNIDFFISEYTRSNQCADNNSCRDAIYKYLYRLLTTNINSYQLLFSKLSQGLKFYENDIFIDLENFSDSELSYIKGFLEWDNIDKNTALFNVVSCCLEYCLLVAGDTYSILSEQARNQVVFLDTNIIFRAIGINGKPRQDVIITFLRKVKQAKIEVVITPFTKQEFFATIDRSLIQINNYKSGDIYFGAYEQISDYNIFSFYYDWLETHKGLSIKGFRGYIQSAYDKLLSDFGITPNYKGTIDIYSKESLAKRREYENGITEIKKRLKDYEIDGIHRYDHDASLVYVAEETQKQLKQKGETIDCMIISTDKVLRYWDVQREGKAIPIVIYPSQLFLVLVKVCGRSIDDLVSFISFINVRNRSKQLSPEKANVVLSGISAVTTDLQTQKILVGSVFNEDFQRILKSSNTDKEIFEKVKGYSSRYLQEKLDETEEKVHEAELALNQAENDKKEVGKKAVGLERALLVEREDRIKKNEKIADYARNRVKWRVTLRHIIFPAAIFALTGIFLLFVLFQFIYCSAQWNISSKFVNLLADLLKVTTFGKDLSGVAYIIDVAIGGAFVVVYRFIYKHKLLNRTERSKYLDDIAQLYIKKNNLL